MLDIHSKIAAALHIIFGALQLATLAVVTLFIGGAAHFANVDFPGAGLLASFGVVMIGLFAAFALAQVISGITFLNGSSTARGFLVVFSVLELFNFPLGSAMGAYSLWALLRKPGVA